MVRRGSTVRVRQRALQKRRKSALLSFGRFAVSPGCSGMEHFLELSAFGPRRKRLISARFTAPRRLVIRRVGVEEASPIVSETVRSGSHVDNDKRQASALQARAALSAPGGAWGMSTERIEVPDRTRPLTKPSRATVRTPLRHTNAKCDTRARASTHYAAPTWANSITRPR
jgi:hypothetical protein